MATTMKRSVPSASPASGQPSRGDDLRSNRITAIAVLAVVLAVTGLVIWLSSLGGGSVEPFDYWPMLP